MQNERIKSFSQTERANQIWSLICPRLHWSVLRVFGWFCSTKIRSTIGRRMPERMESVPFLSRLRPSPPSNIYIGCSAQSHRTLVAPLPVNLSSRKFSQKCSRLFESIVRNGPKYQCFNLWLAPSRQQWPSWLLLTLALFVFYFYHEKTTTLF